MANRSKVKFVIIFFTLLTLISLVFLYSLLSTPVEEKLTRSLYSYHYQGIYNCTASLKPNIVYNNKSSLELKEGPYYRRVIDRIDVSFSFFFEGDMPANFTLKYKINEYIQIGDWKKQINEYPQQIIEHTGNNLSFAIDNILTINPEALQQLLSRFSQDTGFSTNQYKLNITTAIYIEAETSAGKIEEIFMPNLGIESKSSMSEGEIFLITGLEHARTGDIEETEIIYHAEVAQQRYLLYAVSASSLFGLIISSWQFIKSRPPISEERLLEDFIGPYEELIVEAAEEQTKTTTTISVKTFEDLVKVADSLEKPIIYTYKHPETHIFSIIDGLTKYRFTIKTTTLRGSEATTEEEDEDE